MFNHEQHEEDFSLKKLFVPLTTFKAIHIIVIAGFLVFGNMLFNGFVWDDNTYIILNPQIRQFNIFNFFGLNIFNTHDQYRPIPALYFGTVYTIFLETPFFYHFFQLIMHILNTSFIFLLFRNYFNKQVALLLSVLFLVHPIQTESVSFIAASGNPLFFLFGMLALLISLKEKIENKRILLVFILLILSLLTKETGILFLGIILLYRILFARKALSHFLFGGFLVLLLYLLIRFGIGGVYFTSRELFPISRLPFTDRLTNVPAIILYYLKTFFYPSQLVIDQSWVIPKINFQYFYLPMLLDILFFLAISLYGMYLYISNKKIFRIFLFFFVWFVAGLILHSQILPLSMTVADRWFYFPIVGILGMLGVMWQLLVKKPKTNSIIVAVLIVFLIVLSLRTIVRNTNYSNEITLFTHDSQVIENFDLESNLGIVLFESGDKDGAIRHLNKSIKLFPNEGNLYNLGYVYYHTNDLSKALELYYKALKHTSYSINSHKHLENTYIGTAQVLMKQRKFDKAQIILKIGLSDYPTSGRLWLLLAVTEYKLNRYDEALSSAWKAKTIMPNDTTSIVYSTIIEKKSLEFSP